MGVFDLGLFGRAVDMAFGALFAALICGAVSTGTAFIIASTLGVLNVAVDLALSDGEDDY